MTTLSPNLIKELAKRLDQATLEARELERLTVENPDLTIPDAYLIQDEGIRARIGRGEKQIGLKMGLTSEAKRQQMNLKSPCYGVLTDRMKIEDGATFSIAKSIHPKIEPEVAFLIKHEIRGVPTAKEAIDACSGVVAAMEILDSRFVGFKYFSLPDVVADNSSSAYFVVSRQIMDPHSSDWGNLKMVMSVNGKPVQEGNSSDISGNPVNSIIQLCELLTERGQTLPAGSIVLAGAATVAVQLQSGDEIKLVVENLGSVSIKIEPKRAEI
jgi:2-oxo-3-hexenedioate decarboxylase